MLSATTVEYNLKYLQVGYNTALLSSELEEVEASQKPRQSPNCWWSTVDRHLAEIVFRSLKSDPCVYISTGTGDIYILTSYVDDV